MSDQDSPASRAACTAARSSATASSATHLAVRTRRKCVPSRASAGMPSMLWSHASTSPACGSATHLVCRTVASTGIARTVENFSCSLKLNGVDLVVGGSGHPDKTTPRPKQFHFQIFCAYVEGVELWPADKVAQHWGVTPARARAILSNRKIGRVSGYPASDVRAVVRRQGARTDLLTAGHALTLTETAEFIVNARDERQRLRLFFEFCRGADESGPAALPLIDLEPPLTGSERFDALLAGIAEHIASRFGTPAPLWTATTDRFLPAPWWVSPLPSARVQAMLWTPAAFRRRGIYLDRADLTQDGVTPMSTPLFDESELRAAFTALADKLEKRRVIGQVHVVGGAAMILAYDPTRDATHDIDALFSPDGPMTTAIREVANERGWPSTWLNNQAAGYISRAPGQGSIVFDHPYLEVAATPPEHLLAMKVLAARAVRDGDDLKILFSHLAITKRAQVWPVVERYFPGTEIPTRATQLVNDLLPE